MIKNDKIVKYLKKSKQLVIIHYIGSIKKRVTEVVLNFIAQNFKTS